MPYRPCACVSWSSVAHVGGHACVSQVDDLEDISDLEGYIDRTVTILIFCSKGYFQSKNCIREIRSTVAKQKPIIAVLDPDAPSCAMTIDEIHEALTMAEASQYASWGMAGDSGPGAEECMRALFEHEPIEWNRIGAFQE